MTMAWARVNAQRHSWAKDAPHPSAGILAHERHGEGAVVDAELHWKLSHVDKCSGTFSLGVRALRVSLCCCWESLGRFQAATGRDSILCCEDKCGLQPLGNAARAAGETLLVSSRD